MPQGVTNDDLTLQAEQIHKAFEQEFERFVRLSASLDSVTDHLAEAETALRDLDEFEKRATGKKSELASLKTRISPRAHRAASFKAAAFPSRCSRRMSRTLWEANPRTMSSVPSVEPSEITMISSWLRG